jgi:hypothetical protein
MKGILSNLHHVCAEADCLRSRLLQRRNAASHNSTFRLTYNTRVPHNVLRVSRRHQLSTGIKKSEIWPVAGGTVVIVALIHGFQELGMGLIHSMSIRSIRSTPCVRFRWYPYISHSAAKCVDGPQLCIFTSAER